MDRTTLIKQFPKIISHRGNLTGSVPLLENLPGQVDQVINRYGFDVEIDFWVHQECLFLGHDRPTHRISLDWFRDNRTHLWIHCKNSEALEFLFNQNSTTSLDYHFFWHQEDKHTLTSRGIIWNLSQVDYVPWNSVELWFDPTSLSFKDIERIKKQSYGVCTDCPVQLKTMLSI